MNIRNLYTGGKRYGMRRTGLFGDGKAGKMNHQPEDDEDLEEEEEE